MTPGDPTYPAVKDALLALAEGDINIGSAAPKVQVEDTFPGLDSLEGEHLIVYGTDDTTTDWATYGDRQQEERYAVAVDISVQSGVLESKPLRDRAFEIYNSFRRSILADPTLGLLGTPGLRSLTAFANYGRVHEGPGREGRVCVIEVSVFVTARI